MACNIHLCTSAHSVYTEPSSVPKADQSWLVSRRELVVPLHRMNFVMKWPSIIGQVILAAYSVTSGEQHTDGAFGTAAGLHFYGEKEFRESLRKPGMDAADLRCRTLARVSVGSSSSCTVNYNLLAKFDVLRSPRSCCAPIPRPAMLCSPAALTSWASLKS